MIMKLQNITMPAAPARPPLQSLLPIVLFHTGAVPGKN